MTSRVAATAAPAAERSPATTTRAALDVVVALALVAGTVLYLARLPHVLGESDESLYLYEAKRLLEGQVFYRDVFDLITPGAHYLMAGAFALLGTSMATARLVDATMHGLIVATVWLGCRTLGVRPALALVVALADLVVFRPAWMVASPHWLATLCALVVLVLLLADRGMIAVGMAAGLVISVQQQKGALVVLGVVGVLAAESLLLPVPADRERSLGERAFIRRLLAFALGVAAVVGPLVLVMVGSAGFEPVFLALVRHPLVNYREWHHVAWGDVGLVPWFARFTFPRVLAVLPSLAAVAALRALLEARRGTTPARRRQSLVLAIMPLAWVGSILYYPDYIHLAFVGPAFAVVAADLVEAAHRWLDRRLPIGRAAGTAVATCVLAGMGFQLGRVVVASWRDYPFAYDTPFGRLDFHERKVVDLVEQLRAVVGARPGEMFVYPFGSWMYLVTGTTNPTPFQILVPGYSRPDQIEQALAALDRRRVPFVEPTLPLTPGQPVNDYVLRHYEAVLDRDGKPLVYRRRADGASADATPGAG